MPITRGVVPFISMVAIATGTAFGHHALGAQFDLNRSITVTGTVTKVDWSNPHVHLYMDTGESNSGGVMHWDLEMSSPNLLILNGFRIDSFRRGDRVTVNANPARDGSNYGFARKISQGAR